MLFIAVMTLIEGGPDNISAAAFFCFAIEILRSRVLLISGLSVLGVASIIKIGFTGLPAPQSINYVNGLVFVVVAYFKIFREKPQKVTMEEIDEDTIEMIQMFIAGKQYQDMADKFGISVSAVQKRFQRAREKTGVQSNAMLAILLDRIGRISIKYDKPAQGEKCDIQ